MGRIGKNAKSLVNPVRPSVVKPVPVSKTIKPGEIEKSTKKVSKYLEIDTYGIMKTFRIRFRSPSDIITYLNEYPQINTNIFSPQNSKVSPESFAGEPLEQALDYLVGGYQKDFDQFLELKKAIDKVNVKQEIGRKTQTSVVGSRPNVPAYVAGAPKTMYRLNSVVEKKFLTIYIDLSYPGTTTKKQILNRGILVLNLITLLENSGYGVNLKAFQSSYEGTEAFYAEIGLKKPDENINLKKCYYPMCSVEFLRRVMARVLESMPFQENWAMSYGRMMDDMRREAFLGKRDPKAIYITSPQEMGIKGKDIGEDADAFLEKINLSEEIRFPRYKKDNDENNGENS